MSNLSHPEIAWHFLVKSPEDFHLIGYVVKIVGDIEPIFDVKDQLLSN